MLIFDADFNNLQDKDFWLHREHGRSDYLFVLYKSPARVLVNGEYTEVSLGDCIIFDRYKIQSYYPSTESGLLHDYLHFDFESGVEQVLLEDVPLGVPFAVSFPDLISDAVASIKKELYSAASKHQSDILSSLGKIFLYRIKNELDAPTCPKSAKTVFKALHKLRSDIYLTPQLPRTIDSISKQLNISRSYLQHTYKELFGVSCIEDIIIARLTAAKAMLMSSDLTVNEIAEKCGYQSCSHFIRQFGSREGISPEKFRNK